MENSIENLIDTNFKAHSFNISQVFHAVCHYFNYSKIPDQDINLLVSHILQNKHFDLYYYMEEKYADLLTVIIGRLWKNIYSIAQTHFQMGLSKHITLKIVCEEVGFGTLNDETSNLYINFPDTYLRQKKEWNLRKTVKLIDKAYWKQIRNMICQSIRLGHSKESIFDQIFTHFSLPQTPDELTREWFKRYMFSDFSLKEEIDKDIYSIISVICREYFMYYKTICIDKTYKFYECLSSNSRYGYRFGNLISTEETKILILDLFCSEKRSFVFNDLISVEWARYSVFRNIGDKLFMMHHDFNYAYLYLLNIDFNQNECQILQKHLFEIEGKTCQLLFDQQNSLSFVICLFDYNSSNYEIFRLAINGNNFVRENERRFIATFDQEYQCKYLSNDRINGLKFIKNEESESEMDVIYWSNKLSTVYQPIETEFYFQFDKNFAVDNVFGKSFGNGEYCWLDQICYYYTKEKNEFLAFNVDTKRCSSIGLFGFRPNNWFIDADSVLTCKSSDKYCRINLRKPESLLNLTWFNIRRQKMLLENNVYDHALKQLPINFKLQPFNDPI